MKSGEKRTICVVITARPSYSRVKSALQAIVDHPNLELKLVVAASALLGRYGNVVEQIQSDGFEITEKVFIVLEGENPTSMAKTTGLGVMELSTAFLNIKPDMVVSIADRYETIATAIAASYMNIPVVHIQGGEVTGSIDEKVRHAVTKLSDIHFVASKLAKKRVEKLGENSDFVFETGCPSVDLATPVVGTTSLSFDPCEKYTGVGEKLDLSDGYIVVMQHPVTTQHSDSRFQVEETLKAVAAQPYPVLWFWPNVDAGSDGTSTGIRHFRETEDTSKFHFFKNMAPQDFLELLYHSQCLIGNSSVGIRECAYLGVPVVNIGERQNRRERGKNVIDCQHDAAEILSAIEAQFEFNGRREADYTYGSGDAGKKIADILAVVEPTPYKELTY